MGCTSEGRKRLETGLNFPKFMFMKENIGRMNTVERQFTIKNGEGFIFFSPFSHMHSVTICKNIFLVSEDDIFIC